MRPPQLSALTATSLSLHLRLHPLPTRPSLLRLYLPTRPTHQRRLTHTPPDTPPKSVPSNPSYPAFSFEGLGMSSRVKKIVIVLLGIYGTMESIFWARMLWRKFSPADDGGEEGK